MEKSYSIHLIVPDNQPRDELSNTFFLLQNSIQNIKNPIHVSLEFRIGKTNGMFLVEEGNWLIQRHVGNNNVLSPVTKTKCLRSGAHERKRQVTAEGRLSESI